MRKVICLFISFILVISMCFGSVFAEEIVFDVSEEVEETEETVFEEPANWDEVEYVTDDSFVIEEEYVSEDPSHDDVGIEIEIREDVETEEVVSSDEANASNGNLLIDDSVLSEDEIINEETITDDPSFENVVDSGTCGPDVTWKLTGDGNNCILTISGTGQMYAYDPDYSEEDDDEVIYNTPWYDKREYIVEIILSDGITYIGAYAFYGFSNLRSVTISNSVTWIGDGAFRECSNLSTITIPDSVTHIDDWVFENCNNLTSIKLSDNVSTWGTSIFEGCANLKSITIPKGATGLRAEVFSYCKSLRNINVSKDNPIYTSYDGVLIDKVNEELMRCPEGKTGKYEIPNNVKKIGSEAFHKCDQLKDILISDSVIEIGLYAFSGCTGLSSVLLPNSIKGLSPYAFSGCTGITSITIPGSVTSIGLCAFSSCAGLTSVTISNGVTGIGVYAFNKCTSLINVVIPESVTIIGDYAFLDCESLTGITIPSNVTDIRKGAFNGCEKLTIYGYSGSYAEEYAKKNNIPFVSLSTKKVSKITLDKANYNIFVGDSAIIKPTVSPSDAADITLSYKSDDTNIAKVSKSGKITAVSVGTATITISANDGSGVKATCKVNVYNKPTSKLNITKRTLYTKGEPHQFILTPTVNNGELVSVTYSSSAPKKAYVAKSGKVTGKGAGTATITATVKMKNKCGTVTKTLTCKVTVKKPALIVTPTSVSLKKGKTKKLIVKATPGGSVTYTSSNKKIATVSKAGKITAKKKGSCKITVECNGVKKTVKVTVK